MKHLFSAINLICLTLAAHLLVQGGYGNVFGRGSTPAEHRAEDPVVESGRHREKKPLPASFDSHFQPVSRRNLFMVKTQADKEKPKPSKKQVLSENVKPSRLNVRLSKSF